jgi:hypothetical protein
MDEQTKTQENEVKRPRLQKWAIISTIIFFPIAYVTAMPCLCHRGAVIGQFKTIFLLITMLRLIFGIVKRDLKVNDFILWVVAFFIFCIIAESLM